jgi:predicted membrane protein
VIHRATAAVHAILPLLLAGMSAGFVHGLGMRPRAMAWRLIFSPWIAWPLMAFAWIALLARPT